jgi:predicted ArsR family transcriptional regulator
MTTGSDDEDPRRQFSDQDLTEVVREHEPAGTQEIADSIGATRRAVEYRLRSLADDETNDVQAKKIGRTLVWYLDS